MGFCGKQCDLRSKSGIITMVPSSNIYRIPSTPEGDKSIKSLRDYQNKGGKMIPHNKFEKLPKALHALNLAFAHIRVYDGFSSHFGKPGEVIASLPPEEREAIKELTSEMMFLQRFEPWMAESLNRDLRSLKECMEEFDKRIEHAKRNRANRRLYGDRGPR
jgi:hypothetical protein